MATPNLNSATPNGGTKRGRDSMSRGGSSGGSTNNSNKRSTPSKDGGKASKGLRHFSMKVCKKVEEKGHTSYNEVADELVREFMEARSNEETDSASAADRTPTPTDPTNPSPRKKNKGSGYDEKNIRRRVYDALNVLMAMDIISKEKKEIKWKGLPSNAHHDLEMLHREKSHRCEEVKKKRACLKELLVQQVCFRNLLRRNRERKEDMQQNDLRAENTQTATNGSNSNNHGKNKNSCKTTVDLQEDEKIPLPFIVLHTSSKTVIQCEMGPDRTNVFFNFSKPFEMNDDYEIMKRLGMHRMQMDEVQKMLPADLWQYSQEHCLLEDVLVHQKQKQQNGESGAPQSIACAAILQNKNNGGSDGAHIVKDQTPPPQPHRTALQPQTGLAPHRGFSTQLLLQPTLQAVTQTPPPSGYHPPSHSGSFQRSLLARDEPGAYGRINP